MAVLIVIGFISIVIAIIVANDDQTKEQKEKQKNNFMQKSQSEIESKRLIDEINGNTFTNHSGLNPLFRNDYNRSNNYSNRDD